MSGTQPPMDGRKSGREPEQHTFMQTCNLLSQFLKGNVSIQDLSLGIGLNSESAAGKSETSRGTSTMDFLKNVTKSSQERETTSMDHTHMPQKTDIGSFRTVEEATNATITCKEEPKAPTKAAQMTIFYSGKVMVFDEFPADKAMAVILLASKNGSQQGVVGATSPLDVPYPKPVAHRFDLPIARRSSLHRFLEKRKDRAVDRAPYQVPKNPHLPSNNEEISPSSFKNGESSSKNQNQIDLNFKL